VNLREAAFEAALGRLTALRGGREGGRRVLALHGWLDNAASFVPLAPYLGDCDLVALDLPGHGHSAHLAPGSEYTRNVALNAVLDVADALGWPTFTLLAHSMGAGIASLLAAAVPERVEALVAIEALGGLSEAPANAATRMRDSVAATRALAGKPLRVFADLSAAVRARMLANQLSEPVARLLVERGVAAVPGGWQWRTDQRLTVPSFLYPTAEQVEAVIAAIACPTQVIYAETAQPYFPEPLRRQRAALLPAGRLAVLPGNHHLHMEDPAGVAAVVRGFLDAHG